MSISDIETILNFYKEFKEKNVKEQNMIKNSIDSNVKKIIELFEEFKKEINQLDNKAKMINLDLSKSIELDENIDKKIEEIKNREYKIFVTGEAKSGKSTFINAFLGEDILPTGFIQCTSSIIEIRRSKDGKKRLISEEVGGGENREENINKIKEFLQKTAAIPDEYRDIPFNIINDNFLIKYKDSYNQKDISNFLDEIKKEKKNLDEKIFENKVRNYIKNTNWRRVIKRIILEYPLEKLKEVTIFDTPGVGAEGSVGDVTKKYIKEADAFIFVKSLVGQDIEATSFKNFFNENITEDNEKTTFLVFTRKNDTKEGDLEQFEKRLNDTFYKILKKDNIFKLDSLTELHLREYEKFNTGEELKEFLKKKIEKEKNQGNMNSILRTEKSILIDDCDSNLTKFFKEMEQYSDFYKFRDKIDKFVDEAHYLKLISFLEMLKKNCEKGIANLDLIIKSCEENKGNLQEIKNSIKNTKEKIDGIYSSINKSIPFFTTKYTGAEGSIKKIAKDLLNDIINRIEKVTYVEATSYKNIIEKELENFHDYINSINEIEFKKFMKEINSKALQENEKLDLPLNAYLPNFDDEEIKRIFKEADKNSEYYKDTTGMVRGFFNFITFGLVERTRELRKDKDKEKRLIIEDIKRKCGEKINDFEEILGKNIEYGIEKYKEILTKNLDNATSQLDSFLKDLKNAEEMIKKINLTKEVINFYKGKQNKFFNEIEEIENIIGKN